VALSLPTKRSAAGASRWDRAKLKRIPERQLHHVASKQGEIAVEHMAGHTPEPRIDLTAVPSAVYCEPQIASFGLTEEKATAAKREFTEAVFPYRASGKAMAVEATEGLVEVLCDKKTKEILGAHPNLAEAVMETMRAVEGWAIHR
jgi:dihydrolipoamide dehydrogenase